MTERPLFLTAMAVAGIAIASYAALVIGYACIDVFVDHVEPQVAAVSWLFVTGRPGRVQYDFSISFMNRSVSQPK